MTHALSSYAFPEDEALRRLQALTSHEQPGLGTISAMEAIKKVKLVDEPAGKVAHKSSAKRRQLHIDEVQAARQRMIAAGIIKPVPGSE